MSKRKIYTPFQLASAVFMILALLWLTISLPFVYDNQQEQTEKNKIVNNASSAENNEEASNPFGNTTEEKNPNSSNSFSEEFLHDYHEHDHYFTISSQIRKCENVATYIAFHGDLEVPPPDVA
jgi:hypothetical protein